MCFSAEADLVTGLVVGAIGVDVLRHVRRSVERPLAAVPLVLAAHLLVESLVWRGLEGDVSSAVWRPALWSYLVIAFGILPVLVPFAVAALEPDLRRARLAGFAILGGGVAVILLHAVVRGPVVARIDGLHIDYRVDLWHGGGIVALYAVATCGSLLWSSVDYARWVGAANLVAVCLLAWLDQRGLISLWCFWATIVSGAIALHLRRVALPREPTLA